MKRMLCSILLLTICSAVYGSSLNDTLFNDLKQAISDAPRYDAQKTAAIRQLKDSLAGSSLPLSARFSLVRKLYEEYKTFNYDSAFYYAKALQHISYQMKDAARIIDSKIKLSFILVSAGLYKDAFDSLLTIRVGGMPDSIKADFYSLMGRSYYDLADFNNDNLYTPEYYRYGNLYLDSALAYFPGSSFQYAYYKGLRDLKTHDLSGARSILDSLLRNNGLSLHQQALANSTLSGICEARGQTEEQVQLLIKAAIADIRSSTKETTATLYLSGIFFRNGNVKAAFLCVEKAIQDAMYYGARQRQVQVSAILPIIEGAKVASVENQKKVLFFYASVVTILLVFLFVLIIVIYRQNKKLKAARRIILDANARQQEINNKLMEANKIKEEYMIHSYNISTDFFAKIEKFKNALDRKLMERKYDEIRFLLNNVNLKSEKEDMLKSFDKVFLRLFPDFVDAFNALFKEEDRIRLKKDELLNTDLRIFALMRMGITDNEKIAGILEYSVNTIYAYKARIKKKSIVPAKDFERLVMQTKTS